MFLSHPFRLNKHQSLFTHNVNISVTHINSLLAAALLYRKLQNDTFFHLASLLKTCWPLWAQRNVHQSKQILNRFFTFYVHLYTRMGYIRKRICMRSAKFRSFVAFLYLRYASFVLWITCNCFKRDSSAFLVALSNTTCSHCSLRLFKSYTLCAFIKPSVILYDTINVNIKLTCEIRYALLP